MKRRDFMKSVFYTTAAANAGLAMTVPFSRANASHIYSSVPRTLVNVMLLGGADLRYLFIPDPADTGTTDYAARFWEARSTLYQNNAANTAIYDTYDKLWEGENSLYSRVTYGAGKSFGIHNNALWLKEQFDLGNVAIICNVVASSNRRHDHSQLIMHTGDLDADQYVYDRNGWGGRLADVIGTHANVVPVSHDVAPFCNSVDSGNRLDQVVHVKNSRNFALPEADANPVSRQSIMGRALKAYYEKQGQSVEDQIATGKLPATWPYRRFFQHERGLREFGSAFAERLQQVRPALPNQLLALMGGASASLNNRYRLNKTMFGQQVANLYDCLLAPDILQLRAAYLEYGSWDTHRTQKQTFENNIADVFGIDGGLDVLTDLLNAIPGTNENLVYVFTSDFGRQLRANGDKGTDHGEGTYTVVIGQSVRGGVYGEMFPSSEIAQDPVTLETRYDQQGADIEGRTSFERVLGEICDWVHPGSGVQVFPNTARNNLIQYPDGPLLEPGVDLKTLFQPGYALSGDITATIDSYTRTIGGVTITAINANGVQKQATSDASHGYYRIEELSDASYSVSASKPYFTFEPAEQLVTVSGSDVHDVVFQANPLLHLTASYWYVNNSSEPSTIQCLLFGYNFVVGETVMTIGGVTVPAETTHVQSSTFLYFSVAADTYSGELVVTTLTESYVHTVPFENMGGYIVYG